ncbi:MAG: class I SAM-dependent methyltransferase [Planctomycetota bacterium]
MPDTPRLYADLARLWPVLSPPEDYADEVATLGELIDDTLGEPPADQRWSVLELGAGGGHSITHLKDKYDCTAADLSKQMLEQCRALNPDVPTVVGDMRSMRLDQQFDVVLICDAIDYMLTEDDALAALKTAAAHLRPGGLVLMAPTYTRETFVDGDVADDGTPPMDDAAQSDEPQPGVTFFTFVYDPEPADTTFEMILLYLIRDRETRRVKVIEDRHTCGLFSIARWQAMMTQAGLETEALAEQPDPESDADAAAWSVLFRGIRAV